MLRKRHYDTKSHISKDRWMVSYADFITLLFAFFVVMYAVSTFENEGQYRIISESILKALSKPQVQDQSLPGITPNEPAAFDVGSEPGSGEEAGADVLLKVPTQEDVKIKAMADSVREALQPWIEMGLIKITQEPIQLEIEINASVLYDSGEAVLAADAEPILQVIAEILQDFPNAIHIQGFTDNQPISNSLYPSNWELSSARATAVVRMFRRLNIEPSRMAAIGYGEFQPVADNTTTAGRNKNRRVIVVVLSGNDPKNFIEVVNGEEPLPAQPPQAQ